MSQPTSPDNELPRILSGGLVLRRSTSADIDRLAEFNEQIHREAEEPAGSIAEWTRDLLNGRHPTFPQDDFTLVEDPQSGKIVSTMNLISQVWTYAGVPFKVGRPELVGTDPAYRNRGLVRTQFEVIHELSRQRGELLQGITGIPNYYRQFGYEMAVDLGGGRTGMQSSLPQLPENTPEPFRIRPAVESDLPLITDLYQQGSRRSLIAAQWDQAMWHYNLLSMQSLNINRPDIRIIELPSGDAIGYLCHPSFFVGGLCTLTAYELKPGISWYEATPSVIRYLWRTGEEYAGKVNKPLLSFSFRLGQNHPAYQVADAFLVRPRRRYAWYVRIPDLPAFLRHVAPALEARLADSPLTGYSGELKLNFYRSGVLLKFEVGRLSEVSPWQPAAGNYGKAAYPGLTFLQLLLGYRSQEELENAFPDCFSSDEVKPILRTLFPRQPSDIWPIS